MGNIHRLLARTRQVISDLFVFIFSYFIAFIIRYEGIPDARGLKQLLIFFPFIVLSRFLIFQLFSIYSIVWRYISIRDVISIFKSCLPVTAVLFTGRLMLPAKLSLFKFPLSIIILEFSFTLMGVLSIRMIRRLQLEQTERKRFGDPSEQRTVKRILLIGAGDAGNIIIKELKQRTDLGYHVVGFIDDDPQKLNTLIQGVKVLGNTLQIPALASKHKIEEAVITIANASSKEIRKIVDICESIHIKVKIIPGLYELFDDNIKITKIREINIDDLLGRSVVSFENQIPEIANHYKNKVILVTGAGGSIGSELCRQLAVLWPRELAIMDKDENSVYEIDLELRTQFPRIKVEPLVADVRNAQMLEHIFQQHEPEVVFHAAAHKHVPLMEANVAEAILNNVLGTKTISQLADQYKAQTLIYISTDKAVNPSSIMGSTKKIGEIILQEIASKSQTQFSCVRFGNVLGSRGSVVPLFQRQISAGGPITITHPEMRRYFMSISEAVQLIIQAGVIGHKGEILVLDMGEPIKIRDLVKDLIRLSRYAEGDFDIKYIGVRPGEKIREEILIEEEKMKATRFKKIFIAPPIYIDRNKFSSDLERLLKAAAECDEKKIFDLLRHMDIGYSGDKAGPAE